MRSISVFVLALAELTLGVVPGHLTAQPRASERGTVSQIVNGTRLTVDYSRPVARGRDNLIGGVVHWGEMWTPGANWATTFETSRDVTVNGHPLPAGSYSVWMQPQPDEWTVFFNTETRLYHDSPVPSRAHALSFTVRAEEGGHMESLAWYFPSVAGREAELRVHWGPTYVPLHIQVPGLRASHGVGRRTFRLPGVLRRVGHRPHHREPAGVDVRGRGR